ncbi:MAG: hydantoinase/oxoprolinase family protein [Deltaproteobacteria bacterium]|nr:hydantoinase/oxoprolinase family protein [Deltaproteobacteria bacterium]
MAQEETQSERATGFRLGIDVGGTNTDAVILDASDQVIASVKSPTTADVTTGIVNAMQAVLAASALPPSAIRYAMLGTTHCTNAIVTRRGLSPVGVIRLGAPATLAVEPLLTWPPDLRQMVCLRSFILRGGHEYNGEPLAALDPQEIRKAAQQMKGRVRAVAVTGVFSPVNPEHELRARDLVREELGEDVPISLSSEIGSVSLLERENATVLNAALIAVARTAIEGFERAIRQLQIPATLFLGQNDGSLMSVDYALRYPIFTIASGPANSIRGAAYLSQLRDAIVIDIGGTTTDMGILYKGFPRESALAVEIGGVRTNFRMPDLLSIGLGGGSRVHENGEVRVGPDSVGYRLTEEARVFGGQQLTATDLAVAAGRARLGDSGQVQSLPVSVIEVGLAYISRCLEDSIDRIKLSADPVPVVAVGGGSILFPERLRGVSEIIRPSHYGVANAIGVAIAQVSGTIDRVFALDTMSRTQALDEAVRLARERACAAGADPESVEILDLEEIPLTYLPGNAVRIKAKAAGALRLTVADGA